MIILLCCASRFIPYRHFVYTPCHATFISTFTPPQSMYSHISFHCVHFETILSRLIFIPSHIIPIPSRLTHFILVSFPFVHNHHNSQPYPYPSCPSAKRDIITSEFCSYLDVVERGVDEDAVVHVPRTALHSHSLRHSRALEQKKKFSRFNLHRGRAA